MDILMDIDLVGQTADSAAAMTADILTDAAAGWALVHEMELAWLDVQNGASYVTPGIDWAAVEDERIGD